MKTILLCADGSSFAENIYKELGFPAKLMHKVPQNWGASAVLGSPQVEHLAWI